MSPNRDAANNREGNETRVPWRLAPKPSKPDLASLSNLPSARNVENLPNDGGWGEYTPLGALEEQNATAEGETSARDMPHPLHHSRSSNEALPRIDR